MLTNGSFHNVGTRVASAARKPDLGRAAGLRAAQLDPFNCLGAFSDAAPDDCDALRFVGEEPDVPLDGAFKVPSLRGLVATAPYFHDGSRPTLEAVLRHYRSPRTPERTRTSFDLWT